MDAHHLSDRLLCVAKIVPDGARLADIGSDHAYLPAYLALKGRIEFGIAGEVVKGPYENAKQEIKKEGLENIVEARLADGLDAIKSSDQISVITICGMGGTLITEILEKGKDKLANHPMLILQPNVGENNVRQWLIANNYQITEEHIMAEDGHIYEVIAASYSPKKDELSELDLTFGPYLRKEASEAFIAKWNKEIQKLETVKEQLAKATEVPVAKKEMIEQKLKQIGSVLNDNSQRDN